MSTEPTMKFLPSLALRASNIALHGLHQALVVFSIFGWMVCETRMFNLSLLILTFLSWYCLGPILGKGDAYGYCVITDIQWKVRRKLGLEEIEGGYIKYLADRMSGLNFNEHRVDQLTAMVFFACLFASVVTAFLYGGC